MAKADLAKLQELYGLLTEARQLADATELYVISESIDDLMRTIYLKSLACLPLEDNG